MSHFSGDINNSMLSTSQTVGQLKIVSGINKTAPKEDLQINDDFINLLNELDQEVLLKLLGKDNSEDIPQNLDSEEPNLRLTFDDAPMLGSQFSFSEFRDNIEIIQSVLAQKISKTEINEIHKNERKVSILQGNFNNTEKYGKNILDKLSAILTNASTNNDAVSASAKSDTTSTKNIIKVISYIIQNSSDSYAIVTNKTESPIQHSQMPAELPSQSAPQSQPTPKPITQSPVPLMKAAHPTGDVDMVQPMTQDAEIFHRSSGDQGRDERALVRQTDLSQTKSSEMEVKIATEGTQNTGKSQKYQYHALLPVQQLSQRIISQIQTEITSQTTIRQFQTFQEQPKTSFLDVQLEPEGLGVVKVRMSMNSNQLSLSLDFTEADTARHFKNEESTLLSIIKKSDINMDDVVLRINDTNRNTSSFQRDHQQTLNNNSSFLSDFSRQDRHKDTRDSSDYSFDNFNTTNDDINDTNSQNKNIRRRNIYSEKYI